MKVLKVLGIILLVLAGLWLVLAVVTPASLKIEKTTTINAPMATVFAQVNCFPSWPAWSPWHAMDTAVVNTYSENPCGQGAWNSWVGEKIGTGTQTIAEVRENEYLKFSLVFGEDTTKQVSEWFFAESDSGIQVTWNFIGSEVPFYKRPMNLMGKFFLSDAYEKGLAALKVVAESAPAPEVVESPYEILEVELPETKFLLISGEIKPADIGAFYTEKYGEIMELVGKSGAQVSGYPTGLFYSWTDTLAKMSAAIPVDKEVAGTKEIEYRVIEAGKALQINYYGAYDKSEEAHIALDEYMTSKGIEFAGAVREVYVTDPSTEPDTSKWLTQIIYPIAMTK